jgi:hypothetical protein
VSEISLSCTFCRCLILFLIFINSCVLFDNYVLLADDHVNNASYFPFMSIKKVIKRVCVCALYYYSVNNERNHSYNLNHNNSNNNCNFINSSISNSWIYNHHLYVTSDFSFGVCYNYCFPENVLTHKHTHVYKSNMRDKIRFSCLCYCIVHILE